MLLFATCLWSLFEWPLRWSKLKNPTGEWSKSWFVLDLVQLLIVVALMSGWVVETWSSRLLVLVIASGLFLAYDFRWQLKQISEEPPIAYDTE